MSNTVKMSLNSASENQSDHVIPSTVILFVVSAVQFLTPFMLSAIGVALPAIGRSFGPVRFNLA